MQYGPARSSLTQILDGVARRYRVPAMPATMAQLHNAGPASALAWAIEQARVAVSLGEVPDAAIKQVFIDSLADMIDEAMKEPQGDFAFQALVLRHRAGQVRDYVALGEHADRDRRAVHAIVNAVAHPGKLQGMALGEQRESLAALHVAASMAAWSEMQDIARRLLGMPDSANEPQLQHSLAQLLDNPAVDRLRRLEALQSDESVRLYQSLRDNHGPRSRSRLAHAQGGASQRRGAAMEALATRALQALACQLNTAQPAATLYRVATSARVPSSLAAKSQHAKTEWDAVLLRQAITADTRCVWDVCLLIEAKASVDAATTDFARLLRGVRLLAHADENTFYVFKTQEGPLRISGASLSVLATDQASLKRTVLYCSDAPAQESTRMLSAASRMMLLSADASLEYAAGVAGKQHPDRRTLELVWHRVVGSPRWVAVLNQYPGLRQVRELMAHTDDVLAALNRASAGTPR